MPLFTQLGTVLYEKHTNAFSGRSLLMRLRRYETSDEGEVRGVYRPAGHPGVWHFSSELSSSAIIMPRYHDTTRTNISVIPFPFLRT
ncbi:hypothetical protein ACEPAG_7701 [Sanghuangporus baumii]